MSRRRCGAERYGSLRPATRRCSLGSTTCVIAPRRSRVGNTHPPSPPVSDANRSAFPRRRRRRSSRAGTETGTVNARSAPPFGRGRCRVAASRSTCSQRTVRASRLRKPVKQEELQVAPDRIAQTVHAAAPARELRPPDRLATPASAVEGDRDDRTRRRQLLEPSRGRVVDRPQLLHHAIRDVRAALVRQLLVPHGDLVASQLAERSPEPISQVPRGLLGQQVEGVPGARLRPHRTQVQRDRVVERRAGRPHVRAESTNESGLGSGRKAGKAPALVVWSSDGCSHVFAGADFAGPRRRRPGRRARPAIALRSPSPPRGTFRRSR